MENFILTQTKQITMTQEKTVTIFEERLEEVNRLGGVTLKAAHSSSSVEYHDILPDSGRRL